MHRLILSAAALLAAVGCARVDPWGTTPGSANPPTRAMPGPDAAGAQQRYEDPGIRNQPRPLTPR